MRGNSPKLRELVGRAREVAVGVAAENAERDDAEARWPEATMRALRDVGLLALNVPEPFGGHGQGLSGLFYVTREIAREAPSAALCYAMHCVGTAVIAAKATQHQVEAYLEPIAQGRHITTLALSEPGTGSQFWFSETQLRREGDALFIDGTKSFVTNGGRADSYVVSTAAAPETPAAEGTFSCVLLDADAAGVEWQDAWLGLGMRANSSRTVRLSGVRLPATKLLGEPGDQLWYVFEIVAPYFLMAMAGTYAGIAEACLEIAREHLGSRRHSHTGELLGSAPLLAFDLGGMWAQVQSTTHFIEGAAEQAESGDPAALPGILAAKLLAVNAAVDVANHAMTLGGGAAYRENSKLARMLRDARAGHVMAPTTHTLQTWLGRALLKLPLV